MDDLRRARFEEQQADVMEVEHVLTSPFRFLIGLAKWGLLLFFLAVWTVGVFAYKVIGGGDVMTRAAAARELIGRDGSVRTYILDLGQRSFTDQYSPDEGSGYYAPICQTTGWDYNTHADTGIKRQAATLAIAYQNSTIMASSMRHIFTLMKVNPTYTRDGSYLWSKLYHPLFRCSHSTRSGGCDRPQASARREDSVRPGHHRRCLPQRPLQLRQ